MPKPFDFAATAKALNERPLRMWYTKPRWWQFTKRRKYRKVLETKDV